jgi:hypothetical protein
MPNHVTNVVRFDGDPELVNHVLEAIRGDESEQFIDFNKIVPEPDDVKASHGDHGMPAWYNWRVQNWGTKWNAYHIDEEGPDALRFDTAWSTPLPVLIKLSSDFPSIKIHLDYADEDLGNNCGSFEIEDGIATDVSDFDDNTEEAHSFACNLKGYDPEEWED